MEQRRLTLLFFQDGGDSDDDVPDLPVSPGPMSPEKPVSATGVTSPAKSDSSAAPSDVPNGVKVSAEDVRSTPQVGLALMLSTQDCIKTYLCRVICAQLVGQHSVTLQCPAKLRVHLDK